LQNNNISLVSIITVVYNGEKYLEQTIKSVINQTYKNIEYIIIDGGSTDGTLDIIKKYEEHITYWVSEADKGLYDAMNKGIKIAKGELIGMINSDDWYELDAVKTMVNAYEKYPNKSIFHADRYDVHEDGNRTIKKFHPSVFKFKYYGMTYNHPSMFITKTEYNEHLYSLEFRSHSDYKFVLEAFTKDKNKFYYIDKAIVNYRLDGVSANMPRIISSIDVYKIRRSVGMNIFESIFSFFLMCMVTVTSPIKGLFK